MKDIYYTMSHKILFTLYIKTNSLNKTKQNKNEFCNVQDLKIWVSFVYCCCLTDQKPLFPGWWSQVAANQNRVFDSWHILQ